MPDQGRDKFKSSLLASKKFTLKEARQSSGPKPSPTTIMVKKILWEKAKKGRSCRKRSQKHFPFPDNNLFSTCSRFLFVLLCCNLTVVVVVVVVVVALLHLSDE